MAFYNENINDIFKKLKTSEKGINSETITQRKNEYGKNELAKKTSVSFFKRLLAQFKNIMIIILIVSAILSCTISAVKKDYDGIFEGILIFAIVIINALVGVIQEQKAENALDALASSTEPFAKVIRDGEELKIKIHELVVGDVVILKTGDCVPADIRLFETSNLKCDESSMTGESQNVQKSPVTLTSKNLEITDQENMCFSGTSVTSGSAKGVVVSVGKNTELGKIAKILSSNIKEKTPLEKNIDKIGKFITAFVLGIVVVVFTVQLIFHKNLSLMSALLTAVALSVAAIPESLPAVITIIMALGVQKLARKNAIIKKLSAVETLGCCNVICSDKTGTLTRNQMQISHVCINQTITKTQNINTSQIENLITICAICNNVTVHKNGSIVGDATETAITKFLISKKINLFDIKAKYKRIKENEFSSSKKTMSVVCENAGHLITYEKGAIDYILPKCSSVLIDNKVQPLSPKILKQINNANESVCSLGERVIAFAMGSDEHSMTFVGFVGIVDPPRTEVQASILECKKAGLKPIMITGDHQSTAFAIAKSLKIAQSKKEVLTGAELSKLSEKELANVIDKYCVFARVTPEHKLKIVKALKARGNIVSMTGDGINDAPSVKCANIGISMGTTGTDVTKEVSDIIISDDNFSTIVVAIKEGRTIYQNIQKTIIFLLSTNLVEVLGLFVTSILFADAVFLLPTQILFINLITDSLPAFALGIEPPEKDIMQRPPRDPQKSLLSGSVSWTILYQGFVQTLIVLVMFVCARWIYGNEIASTMSFLTICLMQIIHAINCKSDRSIFKTNILKNHFFNFSFIVLFAMILCVYFVPALATLFGLVSITAECWLIISITSLSIIPLVELGKALIKDNKKTPL